MRASRRKILLADGNLDDSRLFAAIVAQIDRSIKVDIFVKGLQALKYLAQIKDESLALIILNTTMPELSGIEVLQRIKINDNIAAVPKILLCDHEDDPIFQEAIHAGAISCFTKQRQPSAMKATALRMLALIGS